MNKLKKAAAVLAAAALTILPLAVPVSAARGNDAAMDNVCVHDPGNAMPAEDLFAANEALLDVSNYIDMYTAVYITDPAVTDPEDFDIEKESDVLFNSYFSSGEDFDFDGTMLYFSSKLVFLSSSGQGQSYYYAEDAEKGKNRGSVILDGVVEAFGSAHDYKAAVIAFCEGLKTYYDAGIPAQTEEPAQTTEETVTRTPREESDLSTLRIYDPDYVLTDDELAKASERLLSVGKATGMFDAVVLRGESAPSYSDSQVEKMSDDLYDKYFNPEPGTDTDGALLFLNLSTRYAYISTSGLGQFYYYNGNSDNRISSIIDGMKSYLRAEDYAGAVEYFCRQLEYYYDRGIPKNAYTENTDKQEVLYVKDGKIVKSDKLPLLYGRDLKPYLLTALAGGGLAALIAMVIIKSSYKLKKSVNPTTYVSQKETHFYQKDDLFLRTHTTKTRIDSDSGGRSGGGGGGGSSHSSGGGHSHGGGGGHW